MEKKSVSATSLRAGGYVILDDIPCKIINMQVSKSGKHGHAKCRIEATGLVNNQKIIKLFPGHDKVEVPIVEKETAQILSLHGDTATVMDMKTYETFDLKIPEELKDQIKEGNNITYWIILNEKIIMQAR